MTAIPNPLNWDLVKNPSELHFYIQVYCGRIYYTDKLLNRFGLLENMLKVRRSEFKNGRSENYNWMVRVVDGKSVRLYDALTIPERTFLEHNLPSLAAASMHFSKAIQNKYSQLQIPYDASYDTLKIECENAINNAYRFITYFYHIDEHEPNLLQFAQKFAVVKLFKGYAQKLDHGIIKKLFDLSREDALKPLSFPDQQSSFYRYLSQIVESKDLVQLVIGKRGLPSNAIKINEKVVDLICRLKSHPNAITTDRIRIWTNTILIAFPAFNGSKLLGNDSVQKIIDENENRIFAMREGEREIRKVLVPYMDVIQAEAPFDQFQFDEWYIELASKKSSKRVRKILLSMMDAHAKKNIHKVLVDSMNSEVVKEFLLDSVIKCNNRIPAEYVCDFASYNAADCIKHAMIYLKNKFKEKFAWSITSEPNRKGIKERYFRTISQAYLSPVTGHLGDGLMAQRDNAHPAKILEIFLNDPKYLDDESEIERIIFSVIDRHDRNGLHVKLKSPNEKFAATKPVNALQLELHDLAFMYGEREDRQMTRTRVRLFLGGMTRFYSCFNYRAAFDNDKSVTCCYFKNSDFKEVYVFNSESFDFIGIFKQYHSFHGAKINQDEEDQIYMMKVLGEAENMLEDLKKESQRTDASLAEVTGEFPIGDFVQGLTAITLPDPATDVSQIVPGVKADKKPLDIFNLKDLKEMKRAEKKQKEVKQKEADSKVSIIKDSLRKKLA